MQIENIFETRDEKQPYNVLFIAIDDLNDWTGFAGGHPQTLTPNMDKLAQQGVIFDKTYAASSLCGPSRAALLTGYRPSTTGVYGNGMELRDSPILKNAPTLPQWFQITAILQQLVENIS